eukprot:c24907_g1_i2 orf=865-4929(-)
MEMVGIMAPGGLREQAMALFNEAKLQEDIAAKTEVLGRVKEIAMYRDTSLLAEFVPIFMEFQTDTASPIRSNIAQIIEEIGLKHLDYMVTMVPVLIALIRDSIPAVVRRAVTAGSNLFRNIFQQVAMQGIYSGHVEKMLEDSWVCSISLKDAIYATAKEHSNDGVRLLTIKFLETAIFLFTPDPNRPSQLPSDQSWDGHGFNIAWLVGGHPVLDAEVLGKEADEYLTYLLEQLSEQVFSKLSGPVAIVLVNSLASIAKRRPALYGLILPAMTRLGSICEGIRGPQRPSVVHAVKNALLNLLRCTHSGAGLWRERLVSSLKAMNAGDVAEAAVRQTDRILRNAERERAFNDSRLSKEERMQFVDHKRPLQENGSVPSDLNANSGKRLRTTSETALSCSLDTQVASGAQGAGAPPESLGITLDSNLTPLQQMIAMIGALVAKGERAAASIEILITSLPADMLADVVIENMKNLPPTAPAVPSGTCVLETQSNTAGSLKAEATSTMPSASILESSPSFQTISEHRRDPRRDPRRMDPRRVAVPVGVSQSSMVSSVKIEETATDSPRSLSSSAAVPAVNTSSNIISSSPVKEEGINASTIPEPISSPSGCIETPLGQETVNTSDDSMTDDVIASSLESVQPTQLETVKVPSPMFSEPLSVPGSVDTEYDSGIVEPMDATEAAPILNISSAPLELASPSHKGSEGTTVSSSTMMSGLPMAMPVVYLDEDRQLALWKVLLLRILESYRVAGSAGGSGLRFGLFSRLVTQPTGDEEAIKILQNYILADYQSHKGHELAMHMLYQLYTEKSSEEGDAIIASAVYDNFLIAVAQGLRDTLPPTDKSLSRLLSEAPMISDATLKWLESICNPTTSEEGTDSVNGERIFQGLSAVWILILLRPPIRGGCLEIALKCAVHELDEVRTKAIRLVANKLYPLNYVSQRIEEFATSMLHNVGGMEHIEDGVESLVGNEALPHKKPIEQVVKGVQDCSMKCIEKQSTGGNAREGEQSKASKSHVSLSEAQRCMSLYFALCTKKVPLLRKIFDVYEHAPKAVKQAAHRNMPVLVRTIGTTSSELLQLLSDPPPGSKNLLLLVLHLLTDAAAPSPELIAVVKKLYESKIKDARLLTPILSSLSKAEVLPIFPHLVALPSDDFKAALDRILQGSIHTGPALTPAEVLIAIHGIDPDRDHIPLSMVKDACAVCFQQRTVFTQQVLAKVLKQLVEQTPVPMLFMRTVILAVGSFRSLVSFVMEILSRLVTKQIWKWPNLWIGFLKCADQTQPHSFHVLLQLPAAQLEKALHKHPNLRAPLTAHANKPSVRSTLPRPTLVVLGLPSEPASSGQAVPDVSSTNVAMERQIREPAATT